MDTVGEVSGGKNGGGAGRTSFERHCGVLGMMGGRRWEDDGVEELRELTGKLGGTPLAGSLAPAMYTTPVAG